MADREQVDNILIGIECVNDAIIADAKSVAFAAGELMMRKVRESQSHRVYSGLNSRLNVGRKFEKPTVEARVVNL